MSPRLRDLLMTSTALLALATAPASAQPTGPSVVGGHAVVTGAGTPSVVINQTTERAIINWNTFNIGTGGAATFNQPGASSITLNRVTGGLGPSMINGTIAANGRVFIINRDGMLFGPGAVINTAGFLASTNDIRNEDFMAGRMNFNIAGRSNASIVNFGNITAASGGFAALVAPGVRNAGTITANLGTVALAAGNSFTLDMYGDKLIQVAVGDQIADKVIDVSTGKPLSALVSNEGALRANGGRVEITAAAARHVVDSVINNKGVIEANTVGTRAGRIVLGGATQTAGLPKQTIKISGRISATGKSAGQKGGTIQITGEDIQFAAALIDASGHSGGGKILVGGDYGGGKPLQNNVGNSSGGQFAALEPGSIPTASTLTVDSATTFNASATVNGNGGKVILWSDTLTTFAGTIFARGGDQGGNGGFVEVSGKQSLAFTGHVDTGAVNGQTGMLLLDPEEFTINGSISQTLINLLTNANVTVSTQGNLNVVAAMLWTSSNSLTLVAGNNLNLSAPITAVNGGLAVNANQSINVSAAINVGTFTLVNGAWVQNTAALPAFQTNDFRIAGGSFLRVTGGNGTSANPYQIADVYGLQGMSSAALLTSNFTLVNDIDATGTAAWNKGTGFAPIGRQANSPFNGSLNGQGFTINGLTLAPNNATMQSVGLFGTIGPSGAVSNLNLTNASVAANIGFRQPVGGPPVSQWVGILAGQNGGTITNVTATGTVSGLSAVGVIAGGLIGQQGILGPAGTAGSISNSWADVNVTVGNGGPCPGSCLFNAAGGLVGVNVGGSSIVDSHAHGNVTGGATTWAGGLVGQNGYFEPVGSIGTIANSYATGNVTVTGAQSAAGGLVGSNAPGSTITNAQAFGAVASTFNATTDNHFTDAGGLVGVNAGTITSTTMPSAATASCAIGASFSCATGNVSVGAAGTGGGLVGSNQGTIQGAFATGNVMGANGLGFEQMTLLGGLAGSNHGTITNSFARTGTIGGIESNFTVAGGLVGDNSGTISNSTASGNVIVGNNSLAGGLAGNNSPDSDALGQGTGASNAATITNASASGNVSVGTGSFGGGFVGASLGTIADSFATGAVTGRSLSMVGGFAAAQGGNISNSHATGNVTTETGFAGGFIGFNFGSITLSYAKGNVSSSGGLSYAGGFAAMNSGTINQAYAIGGVSGGPGSFLGGFVGLNVAADIPFIVNAEAVGLAAAPAAGQQGVVSQSYALGQVTGNNAVVAGGFAALNLGSLDQVYGAGRVRGAATTGGLVGANDKVASLPNIGGLPSEVSVPAGTATNSYWDMQTTGLTASAGGTGLNTAVLASGLPPGFDPNVWSHPSYPYLAQLGTQVTDPGVPVIPPVGVDPPTVPTLPPALEQINANQLTPPATPADPVPNVVQFVQQQQQQQQQQQGQPGGLTTGSIAPEPVRLDVGDPNRHFYLPALNEVRMVSNEVVLQVPCTMPEAALDEILKQHSLTMVGSQCLAGSGNAALRLRNTSDQTISAVIRALAAHQIIAAAQANYTYALTETKVQSATSQQGDPGQYVPEKLRLYSAHRIVTGNNVAIGVIDSEVDGAHPDLTGAIANKYDATGIDDNPHAHGTGMAGAIVSHQRLLGVAPGARILAIRAFSTRNANPESTTFHILKGLDHAVANGMRIVNMSFAGPRDPSLERALKAAHDKGVILIAAAGNAGPRAPAMYPAADPHVIAVTATDLDDKLFAGANRGTYVAVAAPGVDILVPAPSGEYQVTTGTSVATAHVSGVVALMLERNPKLTPADVRRILMVTAKRLGPANMFGAGLIDTMKAIEMATPRSTQAPAIVRPTATAAARP